jgi:hypothetical protein
MAWLPGDDGGLRGVMVCLPWRDGQAQALCSLMCDDQKYIRARVCPGYAANVSAGQTLSQ